MNQFFFCERGRISRKVIYAVIVVSVGSAGWGHCCSHFFRPLNPFCLHFSLFWVASQHGYDGWIGVYWRNIAKEVCISVKSDCSVLYVSFAHVNFVVLRQISPANHRNVAINGRCCWSNDPVAKKSVIQGPDSTLKSSYRRCPYLLVHLWIRRLFALAITPPLPQKFT